MRAFILILGILDLVIAPLGIIYDVWFWGIWCFVCGIMCVYLWYTLQFLA